MVFTCLHVLFLREVSDQLLKEQYFGGLLASLLDYYSTAECEAAPGSDPIGEKYICLNTEKILTVRL